MNAKLRDAALDLELHSNQLLRSVGRGGAPEDLERARQEIPETLHALLLLSAELRETAGPQ